MAYIGTVEYDEGGRIQSLDGLDAVMYDSGRTRNLLGVDLGAVKYDDGGRFRTLVGLGQDAIDIPTDLPLTPPSSDISLMYEPPTPSPIVEKVSTDITGGLVPPSAPPVRPIFYTPLPTVDTVSTPITGALTPPAAAAPPPSSAGTLVSVAAPAASALTSIFNSIKSVFSGTTTAAKPIVAGTATRTGVTPTGPVGASWFSQQSIAAGLPNWGVLAGAGVLGLVAISMMGSGGGRRRRNPSRWRNPAELILMGANPSRRRRAR